MDTNSWGTYTIPGQAALFDQRDIQANYGIADLNVPQIWNTTFVYQMPKLSSLGKAGNYALGSWEISGIWTLHSGQPFSVYGGNNPIFGQIGEPSPGNNNASFSLTGEDHADLVSGQSFDVHQGSKAQWLNQYFNPAAFTFNAPGTFGDSGRNIMYGPGWNNADLMFGKNFPFRERYNVQFRWEMFNALNRPEFSVPDSTVGQPNFGRITSSFGVNYNPSSPSTPSSRVMQAAVKITF